MTKVLIVDDHPRVREALALRLRDPDAGITVVGQAASGEEALRLLAHEQPEVVLLDVSMPGMNGLETARAIGQRYPGVKVLMLTLLAPVYAVEEARRAGAKGFLPKTSGSTELLEGIRAVARGEEYFRA